eukprot:TRINITY_DN7595_c0_g1_i1.p1 TRINITY_DN7595_c0_g1~~TRINITY_DN7595_c0_g1_i1.p1  ORF type:complete len:259 (+),score=44.19 TRINITY_DN7595_c0_g1_i1:89-865(+)
MAVDESWLIVVGLLSGVLAAVCAACLWQYSSKKRVLVPVDAADVAAPMAPLTQAGSLPRDREATAPAEAGEGFTAARQTPPPDGNGVPPMLHVVPSQRLLDKQRRGSQSPSTGGTPQRRKMPPPIQTDARLFGVSQSSLNLTTSPTTAGGAALAPQDVGFSPTARLGMHRGVSPQGPEAETPMELSPFTAAAGTPVSRHGSGAALPPSAVPARGGRQGTLPALSASVQSRHGGTGSPPKPDAGAAEGDASLSHARMVP